MPKPLSALTEAEFDQHQRHELAEETEPMSLWFGLTRASYLTLPRVVLESAPVGLQRRFVQCLRELDDLFGHLDYGPGTYEVRKREHGRFVSDPMSSYRHQRVTPRATSGARTCPRCDGSGWVCDVEGHECFPWQHPDGFGVCGGAGMPCEAPGCPFRSALPDR